MRIILENDKHQVVIVETTNADDSEAVSSDGTLFSLSAIHPPIEEWEEVEGSLWRRVMTR